MRMACRITHTRSYSAHTFAVRHLRLPSLHPHQQAGAALHKCSTSCSVQHILTPARVSAAAASQLGASPSIRRVPLLAPFSRPQHRQLQSSAATPFDMAKVEVLDDTVIHRRYLALVDRRVQVTKPNGEVAVLHYDVAGHPQSDYRFSVAFPFHPATDTTPPQVTLLREWAQGLDAWVFNLPTGGFDPRKHACLRECAVAEMSEEALLRGGEVVRLLPEGHPGIAEVKWCQNRFVPFLFIDPQPDPSPGARDAEEHSMQLMRMDMRQLLEAMNGGDMMLPSITTCHLALAELARRGCIPHPYYNPEVHAKHAAATPVPVTATVLAPAVASEVLAPV